MVSWPCVLALNSLQNAMMLIPCGPSAVPTGGAGLAFPAGIWSFTKPVAFFATLPPWLAYTGTIPGATTTIDLHRRGMRYRLTASPLGRVRATALAVAVQRS